MTSVPGPGDPEDHDELGSPEAIDAAFDAIVANIDHPDTRSTAEPGPASTQPAPQPLGRDWSGWDDLRPSDDDGGHGDDEEADGDEDEGHYEPPPPPPVPRGDKIIRWAWAGAVGAPLLAILLPLLGWGLDGFTGLLLVGAFLTGFVTLISRLRSGPRIDDGPDDGAVV